MYYLYRYEDLPDSTTAMIYNLPAAAKGLGANISATEFAHRESLQKVHFPSPRLIQCLGGG